MAYLAVAVAMCVLSYYMAEKRGRSTLLAIVGGLLFGVFTPLYYLIVGDSEELRKSKWEKERQEKARLI